MVTYATGFNTDYPDLMKRIANTTDSMIYDSTKPTGLYVYKSDILRISKIAGFEAADERR